MYRNSSSKIGFNEQAAVRVLTEDQFVVKETLRVKRCNLMTSLHLSAKKNLFHHVEKKFFNKAYKRR